MPPHTIVRRRSPDATMAPANATTVRIGNTNATSSSSRTARLRLSEHARAEEDDLMAVLAGGRRQAGDPRLRQHTVDLRDDRLDVDHDLAQVVDEPALSSQHVHQVEMDLSVQALPQLLKGWGLQHVQCRAVHVTADAVGDEGDDERRARWQGVLESSLETRGVDQRGRDPVGEGVLHVRVAGERAHGRHVLVGVQERVVQPDRVDGQRGEEAADDDEGRSEGTAPSAAPSASPRREVRLDDPSGQARGAVRAPPPSCCSAEARTRGRLPSRVGRERVRDRGEELTGVLPSGGRPFTLGRDTGRGRRADRGPAR